MHGSTCRTPQTRTTRRNSRCHRQCPPRPPMKVRLHQNHRGRSGHRRCDGYSSSQGLFREKRTRRIARGLEAARPARISRNGQRPARCTAHGSNRSHCRNTVRHRRCRPDIAKLSMGQGVLVDGEKAVHPVRVNVPFRELAVGEMDFLVRFFKLDILIEDATHAKSPLFLRTDFIARYPARCGSSPFRAHHLRARLCRSPCLALRPQG